MVIIDIIIRRFYHTIHADSESQLKKDFIDFPPKPLKGEAPATQFEIVRVRGVGRAFQKITLIKEIFREIVDDQEPSSCTSESADEMKAAVSEWQAAMNNARLEISATVQYFQESSLTIKALLVFLWILFSPVYLFFVIFFVCRSAFALSKLFFANKNNVAGYFVCVGGLTRKTIIFPDVINRMCDRNDEPIISHEHIHMLQHVNNVFSLKPGHHTKSLRYPELLLAESWCEDNHLLYLLQRVELEARLHEMVVSYYREFRELPLTIKGFFALIDGAPPFAECLNICLRTDEYKPTFHMRCASTKSDFYLIFMSISVRSPSVLMEFVIEVLSVMYANLLLYYGDEGASNEFLQQIPRPNLYDRLY